MCFELVCFPLNTIRIVYSGLGFLVRVCFNPKGRIVQIVYTIPDLLRSMVC
jgi:hypothetical protein